MPRKEVPLERDGTALVEFAADLRDLRDRAGKPPYREMAARALFSSTTLSDAVSGKRLPSLAVTLAFVRACEGDPVDWEERWHALTTATPLPTRRGDPPYLGLSAYRAEDADRFFGREALVADLVRRLSERRFVAVFGPSGSGKSSILRAGLVPRLSGPVAVFTPGPRPLEECAVHLAAHLGLPAPAVHDELTRDPAALVLLVRQALASLPGDAEFVLVVDQFEEIFTLCPDPRERSAFLAALVATAHDERGRCRVVIGTRADFYARCAQHADLVTAWQDAMITVTPMTPDELRRAITGPARAAACTVESALVTTLVAEAHGAAGVLPLLSHALLETWHRRQGNALTLAAFHAAGGIRGALVQTAEATFDALEEDERPPVKALFLRLCALGDGTEDTKRRVALTEIDDTSMLDRLTDTRLLTRTRDGVEITHEALIRSWPRLRDWLADDRDGQRLHRELTDATATWERHGRDPGSLLRGSRLTLIADWAWHTNAPLNEAEQRFLDESTTDDDQTHSRQNQVTHRRRALVLIQAMIVIAVFTFLAATIGNTSEGLDAAWGVLLLLGLLAIRPDVADSPDVPDPRR